MSYSSTRRQPPPRSWGSPSSTDGPAETSEPLKQSNPTKSTNPHGGSKASRVSPKGESSKMIEDGPRTVDDLDMETAMKRLMCLSATQCSSGILAVIAGVIAVIYGWPMNQFPGNSAAPIWAGAIVIAAASCGIHASRQKTNVFSELIKNLVLAQFIISCVSFVTTGLMLGWSAWINWDCGKEIPAVWCVPNERELYGISIFSIICSIFCFFVTVPIISLYCFLRNTFYSKLG